jgi:peptide/nickel transport system substrate-binding protein
VVAAYPLPIDNALDQLDQQSNLAYTVSYGNTYEAFFVNAKTFPLNRLAVRQAIAYATDRQTIVDQIVKPEVREGRVLEGFNVPNFKDFYTPAFDKYKPDPDMVKKLMTADGWKKNGDGIWERKGKTASFEVNSTAGIPTRDREEQLWQSQLKQNGFDLSIHNLTPSVLFNERLPKGEYDVALYASVGTPDPGLCLFFCSKNIPAKSNKFGGQNWTWTDSPAIDQPWAAADTELDVAKRAVLVKQGEDALAEYMASIPLYQTPTLFVYDKTRLGGNLIDNTVMGPFFTMNEWTLK